MEFNKSVESHNIKSIERMSEYLKRLFFAYLSIHNTFVDAREEIMRIQNELNFKKPDNVLIEIHNKLITLISDQLNSVLSETMRDSKLVETFIIKKVNFDKNQFVHKLELSLFLKNMVCITKHIGEVSNVSVILINDHVKILRAKNTYDFVLIDNSVEMTSEYFRSHLEKYLLIMKELSGLFYNDIDYSKLAFRNLLNAISETIKLHGKHCDKIKWIELLSNVKKNADEVFTSPTCAKY